LKVIWQYGKRGENSQTVLTIGNTQIENNYRMRVVSNSTNIVEEESKQTNGTITHSDHSQRAQRRSVQITNNNLEIRKLQLTDSGWYECQLPTKPTQINYIYLEVLGITQTNSTKLTSWK
jgi:hypothetical protein